MAAQTLFPLAEVDARVEPAATLTELQIRNFAIIDRLHLRFHGGLNILTGETGAGKSIIIDAIGLLLGDRVAAEMVRAGADRAQIEGDFPTGSRDADRRAWRPKPPRLH